MRPEIERPDAFIADLGGAGDPARESIECKQKLESYLREHGVSFETQHHAVAYTAQEIAAAEHVSGEKVVKVVIAFAGARMVMLALPATRRVDLEKAALAVGAETLRLAKEDEFAATFPGCDVGAMPPFGNLYNLAVYVDTALKDDETIVFQAGTHTDTVSLRYVDFLRLVQPVVADLARHPN